MNTSQSISDQDFHLSRFVQHRSNPLEKTSRSALLSLNNVHKSHTHRTRIALHHDSKVYLSLRYLKRIRRTYVENMACIHSAYNSFRNSQSFPEIGPMPHQPQSLSYVQHHQSTFFRFLLRTWASAIHSFNGCFGPESISRTPSAAKPGSLLFIENW